jgi:hypothetical protein
MTKAFEDCLKKIGEELRTADDLIRQVLSGEVVRAITGHVTERLGFATGWRPSMLGLARRARVHLRA